MEQYLLSCRHCVDEAAQNGSLEFTLTDLDGSPSESLCPRHLLTDKLDELNSKMKECEREGDYLTAASLKGHAEKLKSKAKSLHHQLWAVKHKKSLSSVKKQEKVCQSKLRASYKERMSIFEEQYQAQLAQVMSRQALELIDYRDELERHYSNQPPKFSAKLIELRRSEKILVAAQSYIEAHSVKTIADKIESQEYQQHKKSGADMIASKMRVIEKGHRQELNVMGQRLLAEQQRLVQQEKEAQEYLFNKARSTAGTLKHAYLLHSNQREAPTPMMEAAALSATKQSQASIAAFAFYSNTDRVVDPIQDGRSGGPRPQTAGGTKKNLSPLKKRPSTSHGRIGSSSKGKERQKEKERNLVTCGHCNRKCGSEFVSIPPSAGMQFIGTFCTWECAKSWNTVKSPLQFRWIRNVLIDQAAGYLVEAHK